MGIKILGTGSSIPKFKMKNDDFTKIETSDEWIYTRTGIKERHFVKNEKTSDLAYDAAKKAISDAKIDVSKIKYVICATMTPDTFTPTVASKILSRLGIQAMAFDMNVACSGFVYALNVGYHMLKNDECALIIGAESVSKLLDFQDRSSCVLFGDGAGAAVITKDDSISLFYANSKTDENEILNANGLSQIKTGKTLKDFKLTMNGKEVFKFALESFKDSFNELEKNGVKPSDIDLIIPHQANKRIIESVAKKNQIEMDKFYLNLHKYGNTSSASVAIALDEARKDNTLKPGMKTLLVGFGSGLAWGYCLIEA